MTAREDRSSAITTGSGWGRWESHDGDEFRWINSDALLYVATLRNTEYRVDLHIEPGPSQKVSPLVIDVTDVETTEKLAVLKVRGRQRVAFALPVGRPRIYRLRLSVATPGEPCDGRILNFRVFEIKSQPISNDVLPPAAGFGVGRGWGRLEVFDCEFFRWVNNDAIVDVLADARFPLYLEIEGGPGLRAGATLAVINDADDKRIYETTLAGRQLIIIMQNSFVPPGRLKFHVDGGGETSASDPRILNFRAFESPSFPAET